MNHLIEDLIVYKATGSKTGLHRAAHTRAKLLEDKLYAHHAIQDSLEVSDAEIRSYVDQQITQFLQQTLMVVVMRLPSRSINPRS